MKTTPTVRKLNGLAAWLEIEAEVRHACASNEADSWEAGRLLEAAKQLRKVQQMENALLRIARIGETQLRHTHPVDGSAPHEVALIARKALA
jgi:hypothetical protein